MRSEDTPRSTECQHESRTHEWNGFDPPVKDMYGDTGPCDQCADARCPVGSVLRLTAFRIRAAQLVAQYGYDLDVQANMGAHGIDLRCRVDNVEWLWEFTRNDPEAITQAIQNRNHILEYLRSKGVDVEPGPAFGQDEFGDYFSDRDVLTRVQSHGIESGIEVFEVFDCRHCAERRQWLYRDSRLRSMRLEDLLATRMSHASDNKHGRATPPRFARRKPSEYSAASLQLSANSGGSGWQPSALRTWFSQSLTFLDAELVAAVMAAPPDGFAPHRVKGKAGTMVGILEHNPDWLFQSPKEPAVQLNPAQWQRFLDHLATQPVTAQVWCGPISEYGWAQSINPNPRLQSTSRFHDESRNLLSLTLKVNEQQMQDHDVQLRLLRIARATADDIGPCYGEIGSGPGYTGIRSQTMLERLLYLDPADTISHARQRLRGYAWLTICPQEIGDKLGGLDGLTETDAFHKVDLLANGGFWLQATEWYEDYGVSEANRVFQALQRFLPAGCPTHVEDEEPNLIVPKEPVSRLEQ